MYVYIGWQVYCPNSVVLTVKRKKGPSPLMQSGSGIGAPVVPQQSWCLRDPRACLHSWVGWTAGFSGVQDSKTILKTSCLLLLWSAGHAITGTALWPENQSDNKLQGTHRGPGHSLRSADPTEGTQTFGFYSVMITAMQLGHTHPPSHCSHQNLPVVIELLESLRTLP